MNRSCHRHPLQAVDEGAYWLPLADVLLVLIAFCALLVPIRTATTPLMTSILPVRIDPRGNLTIQGRSIPLDRLAVVAAAYASRQPDGRLRLVPAAQTHWGSLRPVLTALQGSPAPVELKLPESP